MATWIIRTIIILIVIILLYLSHKIERMLFFERRIKRYSIHSAKEDISFMDKAITKYKSFISRFENNQKLQKHSENYKKYITVGEKESPVTFLLYKLTIGIIFTLIVMISSLISGKLLSFLGIIISFIIGYYLYDIYLYISLKRKTKKIKNDMLRAIILLNNSFKAGKSILQAVKIASQKLPKPISEEFKRISQDMSYGLSADVAFQRFAKRVNLEEATYVASSLTILNKTGGNIVSVFTSIEKTLFDRKKLENDLKTSAAASNFVVKFLMIIPIMFVLVIYVNSPTYFNPLFSSPLGYFLLLIMWIMFITFIYLLGKIMKVKV